MELEYDFIEYQEDCYRCSLNGYFIAFTNHSDSNEIDKILNEELGMKTRKEFIEWNQSLEIE